MENILLSLIFVPLLAGSVVLIFLRNSKWPKDITALLVTFANLVATAMIFKSNFSFTVPWASFGFEFSLRLYQFSAFIILASAGFGFLITLYSVAFMREKSNSGIFFGLLLISLSLVNGAVLSNNLVLMLFFWEALLVTLWGMIAIGNKAAYKTATKAFIIVGISDLCLMAGIAICGHIAGTFTMSNICIGVGGIGGLAFILMVIGAIAKAGSMPFHTWIPDAALDAHLPFMAILPAALEKLLGIYLLARISLDMFKLSHNSWASYTLMTVGAITILGAVLMALIQKDYKRLLSYHAISQVGYMILGIGTLVPIGIVGGLFHMINHAMYKSCLFLTGGSVEKQAGTTDLEKLGGLGRMMPITFICFIITAASISGVPPFNGFFSKELIYDGALERGMIFYIAAVLGSFLTAASFLKLGHAAFMGRANREDVKEAPISMLAPMITIASLCVIFGLWNSIPLKYLIQPILGSRLEDYNFAGWPTNTTIVWVTIAVLIAAVLNHMYGVKRTGSGLKAVDHIHHAPILSTVYDKAERGVLDPYNIGMGATTIFAYCLSTCDKATNWIYDSFIPTITDYASAIIRGLHDGSVKTYIIWSLVATAVVISLLLK